MILFGLIRMLSHSITTIDNRRITELRLSSVPNTALEVGPIVHSDLSRCADRRGRWSRVRNRSTHPPSHNPHPNPNKRGNYTLSDT